MPWFSRPPGLPRRSNTSDFIRRSLADRTERDIAHAIVQHHGDLDRANVNLGPRELERDRLLDADPADLELHRRARRAAQLIDRLVLLPAFRGAPVERDDFIPGLHAGPLGRGV